MDDAQPPTAAGRPKPPVDRKRRGVLGAIFGTVVGWGFATLGATVAIWSAGTARFMFPNILTEPPQRFKVGFPGQYPPGYVETRFKEQYGIWLGHGLAIVISYLPSVYAL